MNAIVRLSVGSDNTGLNKYPPVLGVYRVPAIAIKLFPTQDPNLEVITQNVIAFDSHGFDGNSNQWFMQGNWWSTWLFGTSIVTKSFVKVFERYVANGRLQSVRPVARVNQYGATIPENQVRSPGALRITSSTPSIIGPAPDDYRKELMVYGNGEMKFNIIAQGNLNPDTLPFANTVIGRLTVGVPVISENCDMFLHFHHSKETK